MSNDHVKKRVLFVSPFAFTGGGAERVILDHARHLDRERFEPFAAVTGPGTLVEAFRALGVETYVSEPHSEAQPLAMARELWRFGRFVKERGIDVVVGNKHRSILYWGLSAARRVPFVWLLHDPLPEHGFVRRITSKLIERFPPSWTIWVTNTPRESYQRRFVHLRGPNSSQIFPGTSPEELSEGADAARAHARFEIPEGAPVLTVFARMQPSKGQLDLVAAAPKILAQFPEARFLLCGGTLPGMPVEHEQAVRAAIAAGGLEQRVLLLGQVSEQEKRDILAATTILVHPAQWEPFGIAVIEGLAVGKPAVVADASGPAKVVDHDETGLVVPRGNPAALAAGIVSLLADPERARRMGALGAERIAARYHARVAARRLGDVVLSLL